MELSRDQILQAARNSKIERERMHVKELGGDIWVRGMTGTERDEFEEQNKFRKGKKLGQIDGRNYRAKLAVKVIVTENGERILNDHDASIFGQMPANVLERVLSKCKELSGMTEEEVEEMGNGSETEGSGGSSSISPSVSVE